MIESFDLSHPSRRRNPKMMLPSRHYESEHTIFIRELMTKNPEPRYKQTEDRAIALE